MNEQLDQLIQKAILESEAKRYPGAQGVVNGKTVEVRVVSQCRRTTTRSVQKPSLMWKVDGKRVKVSEINAAITN